MAKTTRPKPRPARKSRGIAAPRASVPLEPPPPPPPPPQPLEFLLRLPPDLGEALTKHLDSLNRARSHWLRINRTDWIRHVLATELKVERCTLRELRK
jgi:hypothetical protein